MTELQKIVQNPDFQELSPPEQKQVLGHYNPDFKKLGKKGQTQVINYFLEKTHPHKIETEKGTVYASKEPSEAIDWKTVIPREAARVGGGIVGGVVGIPGGPPGVIAGVGLGATAGEAYHQIGQHISGDPNAPETSLGAAKRMGKAGLEEAALETVGGLTGKMVGKILAPFRKKVIPEAMEIMKQTKDRLGPVVFTPAEATESKGLDILQNISEVTVFGQSLKKFKMNRQTLMNDWADDIIDIFGHRDNPSDIGELFVDVINNKQKVHKALSASLYNNVEQLSESVTVSTEGIKSFVEPLKEISEQLGSIEAKNSGDDIIQAVLDLPDDLDFATAKELRTRLLSRVDEFSILNKKAPAIGKAKKIISILDESISKSLKKQAPEGYEAWREANEFYKKGQERFNRTFIRRLLKTAEETGRGPEFIAEAVFRPRGVTNIKRVKEALTPKQWTKMQSFYIQDLFRKSVDEEGAVIGTRFYNQLIGKSQSAMGKTALKEIFTPEQLKEIILFSKTLQMTQARQSEGLGKMLIQLAQGGAIAGFATGFAPEAAAILITPPVLSKMMLMPKVTKWLTQGIKTPSGSPEVLGIITRLIAASRRIQQNKGEQP